MSSFVAAHPKTSDVALVPDGTRPGAGRLPALDGLRGIAVLAVMAFHAGVPGVRGGLLGVDIFFVLSGFLITALLLAEHASNGRISLIGFWRRRLRRLMPAMLLMLAVVVVVWQFTADPASIKGLRTDAESTLGYVANWHFAAAGQSYFDHFSPPSPVLHMWSLAVEEQFYLLWPLVVILILWRGSITALRRVAVLGALASAGVLAELSLSGVSTTRLYYGTDTRIAALLVGAALATLLTPFGNSTEEGPQRTRRVATVLGLAAAAALLAALIRVDGQSPELYRGGFLAVALLVGILVASALLAPRGPIARVLSFTPLRLTGRISYALYLWHWPIFLFLTSARTGLPTPALLTVRLATTVLFATLSWFLVEHPILRLRLAGPRLLILPATALVAAAALFLAPLPRVPVADSGNLDLNALERQSEATPPPPPSTATQAGGPLRLLLVGDSTALTLGLGMDKVKANHNAQIYDRGIVGCGISTYSPIRYGGQVGTMLNDCYSWADKWAQDVQSYRPQVAAVLLGRWEVADRWVNGRWVSLGDPSYDQYLSDRLDFAISILSAHGAKVALLTSPLYHSRENVDGAKPAEDDPARVTRWNELLHEAAARHPDKVRVFDLASLLDPHGQFQRYSDDGKIELRSLDGIHIGLTGGEYAGDALYPQLTAYRDEAPQTPTTGAPTSDTTDTATENLQNPEVAVHVDR